MPFGRPRAAAASAVSTPCGENVSTVGGISSRGIPNQSSTMSARPPWLKSHSIPSESPEGVVALTPVIRKASQSPGSSMQRAREKIPGSFSFTHASLEAVKLPGELSRRARHVDSPMPRKAFSPIWTARLSHQMIDGRSTFPASSRSTRPCIW